MSSTSTKTHISQFSMEVRSRPLSLETKSNPQISISSSPSPEPSSSSASSYGHQKEPKRLDSSQEYIKTKGKRTPIQKLISIFKKKKRIPAEDVSSDDSVIGHRRNKLPFSEDKLQKLIWAKSASTSGISTIGEKSPDSTIRYTHNHNNAMNRILKADSQESWSSEGSSLPEGAIPELDVEITKLSSSRGNSLLNLEERYQKPVQKQRSEFDSSEITNSKLKLQKYEVIKQRVIPLQVTPTIFKSASKIQTDIDDAYQFSSSNNSSIQTSPSQTFPVRHNRTSVSQFRVSKFDGHSHKTEVKLSDSPYSCMDNQRTESANVNFYTSFRNEPRDVLIQERKLVKETPVCKSQKYSTFSTETSELTPMRLNNEESNKADMLFISTPNSQDASQHCSQNPTSQFLAENRFELTKSLSLFDGSNTSKTRNVITRFSIKDKNYSTERSTDLETDSNPFNRQKIQSLPSRISSRILQKAITRQSSLSDVIGFGPIHGRSGGITRFRKEGGSKDKNHNTSSTLHSILKNRDSVNPNEMIFLKNTENVPRRDPTILKALIESEKNNNKNSEDDLKIPYFLQSQTEPKLTRFTATKLNPNPSHSKNSISGDSSDSEKLSASDVARLIKPSEESILESIRQLKSLPDLPSPGLIRARPRIICYSGNSLLDIGQDDPQTVRPKSETNFIDNQSENSFIDGVQDTSFPQSSDAGVNNFIRSSETSSPEMESSGEIRRTTVQVAVDVHNTNSFSENEQKDRDISSEIESFTPTKQNNSLELEPKRILSRNNSNDSRTNIDLNGIDSRISLTPMQESELAISTESQESDVAVSQDYDTSRRRQSSESFTESFKHLQPFNFNLGAINELQGKRERLYKVLVVGELGTGKTSIIKRYVHQFFSQHYRATIGVDFALKVIRWDPDTVVRLQLWDIAGQERFGSMTRVYYKEAVGAFVVFDVTRAATLEAVPKWKADLDSKVVLPDGRPIPTVLLANKSDQPKEGVAANREKMNEFSKQQGFSAWFETSAKENIHIDEAASFLVSKILEMDRWSQEPIGRDPDKLDLRMNGKHKSGGLSDNGCAC